MIKKYLLFGYLSLLFFGFSLLVEASSTEVQSITPNTGNSITYTKVKINGSGFTPIPKVALYGGGPYIIGSCNTQGQAQDVYVKGSYAYVANFQGGPQVTVGLQVIDISDPNIPSIVGSCYLPVKPNAVYVDGLYAYVTAWDDPGLHEIDISDPTNPNIVGSCDTSNSKDIYVQGSYAYVATMHELKVVDISNPTNPTIVGARNTGEGQGVYIQDSYAYVVYENVIYGQPSLIYSGLLIIDISNANNPTTVGSCTLPDGAKDIYIQGAFGYVAGSEGLQIINISNPANPVIVGSCDVPYSARSVHIQGSYAYVSAGNAGLQIVDITNPTNLTIIGSCNTPDSSSGLYVQGAFAYLAVKDSGLQVIDINITKNTAIVASCYTPNTKAVHVTSTYAYVLNESEESSILKVIDISNPTNPTIVGSCNIPGNALDFYVQGTFSYVANDNEGLKVIDISNPTSPGIVGTCDNLGSIKDIYAQGSYVYYVNTSGELKIIDINTPTNPFLVSTFSTSGGMRKVFVLDSYAYVADGYAGLSSLKIVNITDPTNLAVVGSCNSQGTIGGIYIQGSYAYLAVSWSGQYGLRIVDISNPTNPRIVGSCDASSNYDTFSALGICVQDSYAYLANDHIGLQIIDVNNPSSPIILDSCGLPGALPDVYVQGSYVYMGIEGGFQVIQPFRSLIDIDYLDSNTITATISPGLNPGTYNLHITNLDGTHTMLPNIFTVYRESIPNIYLSSGLNIFGYPVEVPQGYTSYDLILSLGTKDEISRIQRYDPNTKTYWTTAYDLSGIPCGYNFNIGAGEGFIIYMKTPKSIPFDGSIIRHDITLTKGLNIVSIPYIPPNYTYFDLLLYLGTSDEIISIQRYNNQNGTFESTAYFYGKPSGIKFKIASGEAYLINMKVAKYKDAPK